MLTFTITGNLPRKSNSRRIVRNRTTGRPFSIKSAKALTYEQQFIWQARDVLKGTFEYGPLKLTLHIYYQSRRSDLSDELFCDLMQKSGIIPNDRCIEEKHLYLHIDKNTPRVEAEISLIK